jgi:hypothetical protein
LSDRIPPLVALGMLLSASAACAANPLESEHAAALQDARRLGPAAVGVRYLTVYNVAELRRPELRQVLDFWVNSLSREAEIVRAVAVTPTLLRINIFDYSWNPKTFDALANEDPFFHVQLKVGVGAFAKAYFPAEAGSKAGWYDATFKEAKVISAIAPWLPAVEAAELVALTQTAAPILRADWFLSRVAVQAGRKGTGYYDWFELKKRADFEKLVAFDLKASQGVKREVAGIVARSGVSNFPRQIFRFQSVTGGYWVTRDVLDDNKDARNALRQLDGDLAHQAEEIYGVLPNGLFAFYLSDAAGVQQDTAPDKIGSDKTAPGNDGRIHAGKSCVVCHTTGLNVIADWSRRAFSGDIKLTSPDPDKARRLKQLYLGELQEKFSDDVSSYVKVLRRVNGLTSEANAKAVGRVWEAYVERDVLPRDVAPEFGLTEEDYLSKLRAAYKANPLADVVLASHLSRPPIAIRQDDWEQLFPLVAGTVLSADLAPVGLGGRNGVK